MHIVVYILGGLYLLLAAGLVFTYYRGRHPGIALMAMAYGFSGIIAIGHVHWWPLVVGLALAWILRFMGFDPSVPRPPR